MLKNISNTDNDTGSIDSNESLYHYVSQSHGNNDGTTVPTTATAFSQLFMFGFALPVLSCGYMNNNSSPNIDSLLSLSLSLNVTTGAAMPVVSTASFEDKMVSVLRWQTQLDFAKNKFMFLKRKLG